MSRERTSSRSGRIWAAVLVIGGFVALGVAQGEAAAEKIRWRLVFEDDFSEPELDGRRWRIEDIAPNKNNELEYYAPDEVFVSNGCLVLRSRRRKYGGRDFTSGLVDTRGRMEAAFGRFEVRARLPGGQGIWPAIWLLPASGDWPPEMDIVELLGDQPRTVHMTVHWGEWPDVRSDSDLYTGPDFTSDFHVFRLDWLPEKLVWYVDGVPRFESSEFVPRIPMYLIINTAVGGDWPGEPDETTPFPVTHLVDYVRVYMPEEDNRSYLMLSAVHGTVEVSPFRFVFSKDERVRLKAVPEIGYRFCGWSGDLAGRENPVTISMRSNRVIRALCEKDPHGPLLLSRGKKVKVSSIEAKGLEGANAVDGDRKTRWSSRFSDPQWIIVDLGRVCRVSDLKLVWERAHADCYEILASVDGKQWRRVRRVADSRGRTERFRNLDVKARFIKLNCLKRATEWGYSLWELEVYGMPE